MICDKRWSSRIRQFINFGIDRQHGNHMIGMNAKISEYSCAVALTLLDTINEHIDRRLENAAHFRSRLGDLTIQSWVDDTVYQTFPVFIDRPVSSPEIIFGHYYEPLTGFETSQKLFDRNICLPVHSALSKKDIELICRTVLQED